MRRSLSGVDRPDVPETEGLDGPALLVNCGVPLFASSDGLGLILGVVVHELVRSATSSCSISSSAEGPPVAPSSAVIIFFKFTLKYLSHLKVISYTSNCTSAFSKNNVSDKFSLIQ